MKRKPILTVLVALLIIVHGCNRTTGNDELRVIHAGSLTMVVKEVIEAYHAEHPGVRILTEAWGSKDGARQITELGKPCDIYISADDKIIEAFLFPDHAQWSIPFAGNEMVLAFTAQSRYADVITSLNWYDILGKDNVFTGRSSPDADPCGVRAMLVMFLSEKYYSKQGLADQLISKDPNFIRPKEADLIALLQKRSVDYVYIYKSLAVQHGFRYIRLPDSINLGNPALREWYSQVSIETAGRTPKEKHLETGAPIVYGITIPKNAHNISEAVNFLDFFLNPDKGGKIITKNGQNVLPLSRVRWFEKIPDPLKKYALQHEDE